MSSHMVAFEDWIGSVARVSRCYINRGAAIRDQGADVRGRNVSMTLEHLVLLD